LLDVKLHKVTVVPIIADDRVAALAMQLVTWPSYNMTWLCCHKGALSLDTAANQQTAVLLARFECMALHALHLYSVSILFTDVRLVWGIHFSIRVR